MKNVVLLLTWLEGLHARPSLKLLYSCVAYFNIGYCRLTNVIRVNIAVELNLEVVFCQSIHYLAWTLNFRFDPNMTSIRNLTFEYYLNLTLQVARSFNTNFTPKTKLSGYLNSTWQKSDPENETYSFGTILGYWLNLKLKIQNRESLSPMSDHIKWATHLLSTTRWSK